MGELAQADRVPIGAVLWREKWVIVATIVVVMALAVAYTLTSAKVYQANGIIQVSLPTSAPGTTDTTSANQALAQNYAELLTSPGFLTSAKSKIDNGRLSVSELQSRLSASALATSALVQLSATGPSPDAAQQVATQTANAFLTSLRTQATSQTSLLESQLQSEITTLSDRITALRAQPPTPAITQQISSLVTSRTGLINQNAGLVSGGLAQGTSASLAATPVASSDPISPKKSLNIIGGLLLGIVLGIGLAWTRHRLRPAVHSAEEVATAVGLPLLASVPLRPRANEFDPALQEAYGVFHANLTFALRDEAKIVCCVGFNSGVGKTSSVAGLAKAASQRERLVLMVDGDMRAATLSARLGHADKPGLVDVLQGAIPLEAALVRLDDGTWLLPTRRSLLNPGTLLSTQRTTDLMDELRRRFDLVVIDSPPLSGLADGLLLASYSDVAVLVVRTGITKPADLAAAVEGLNNSRTSIVGTVVFEDRPADAYYGGTPTVRPAVAASAES